jgi:hypothetical protein
MYRMRSFQHAVLGSVSLASVRRVAAAPQPSSGMWTEGACPHRRLPHSPHPLARGQGSTASDRQRRFKDRRSGAAAGQPRCRAQVAALGWEALACWGSRFRGGPRPFCAPPAGNLLPALAGGCLSGYLRITIFQALGAPPAGQGSATYPRGLPRGVGPGPVRAADGSGRSLWSHRAAGSLRFDLEGGWA